MRKPDVDLAALRALGARVYGRSPVEITRTCTGTTTQVYRLRTEQAVHYLRVAEDQPDRYGVEVLVHERLLQMGVRVPEIIHYEPFDPALDRSILITAAIPGRPIADLSDAEKVPEVLREAGRDLARINSIPVTGFGFMERSAPFPTALVADFGTALAFIESDLESDLVALRADFPGSLADKVRIAVRNWYDRLLRLSGRLAHGDFDVTHVFADERGYTGIIDFGEIRGADPLYDLGHFAVITGDSFLATLLEPLLAGYRDVTPLADDDLHRMWLWAALIGVRFLARTRSRSIPAQRAQTAERIAQVLRQSDR